MRLLIYKKIKMKLNLKMNLINHHLNQKEKNPRSVVHLTNLTTKMKLWKSLRMSKTLKETFLFHKKSIKKEQEYP